MSESIPDDDTIRRLALDNPTLHQALHRAGEGGLTTEQTLRCAVGALALLCAAQQTKIRDLITFGQPTPVIVVSTRDGQFQVEWGTPDGD